MAPRHEHQIESHRLASCIRRDCHRLFAICRKCGGNRFYCSRSCAALARARRVLEAGQRYQQTPRGRVRHAARQARYRERLRARVTHQSLVAAEPPAQVFGGDEGPRVPAMDARAALREASAGAAPGGLRTSAEANGSRGPAPARDSEPAARSVAPQTVHHLEAPRPGRRSLGPPPTCAFCGRQAIFLRHDFLTELRRRPPPRPFRTRHPPRQRRGRASSAGSKKRGS